MDTGSKQLSPQKYAPSLPLSDIDQTAMASVQFALSVGESREMDHQFYNS